MRNYTDFLFMLKLKNNCDCSLILHITLNFEVKLLWKIPARQLFFGLLVMLFYMECSHVTDCCDVLRLRYNLLLLAKVGNHLDTLQCVVL